MNRSVLETGGEALVVSQFTLYGDVRKGRRPDFVAAVYAELGEVDAAFEWLEKAYERRSLELTWIRVNPIFDPLRSDPRFQDLLRRIGFPES